MKTLTPDLARGKVPAVAPFAALQPELARSPRTRAVRGLLEIAELRVEQRDLLVAALTKARKRRDRPLATLIEAALLANHDLAAEVDAAGLALGQIDVLWSSDDARRGR